jgi:hypothetical protein
MALMRLLLPLLLAMSILPACNSLPATTAAEKQTTAPATGPSKTMYVASYTRTCTGMYEMQCMLVKEKPGDEWSNFYDPIEGFTYEPGYEYELVVGWRDIPNPPADGSSRAYWLVSVVKKTWVGRTG